MDKIVQEIIEFAEWSKEHGDMESYRQAKNLATKILDYILYVNIQRTSQPKSEARRKCGNRKARDAERSLTRCVEAEHGEYMMTNIRKPSNGVERRLRPRNQRMSRRPMRSRPAARVIAAANATHDGVLATTHEKS